MKKLFSTLLFILLLSTNTYASEVPLNDNIGAYNFMQNYNNNMIKMKLPYRIVSIYQLNEEEDSYHLSTNIGELNDNFFIIKANQAGYIRSVEIFYNRNYINSNKYSFNELFKREIIETIFSIGINPDYKHEADEIARAIKVIMKNMNSTSSFWSTATGRRYILTNYNTYKNNYHYYVLKITSDNQ